MSGQALAQQTPSTHAPLVHCVASLQSSPLPSIGAGISASEAASTSPPPPAPPVPSGIACVRAHEAAARPNSATPKATRRATASENDDHVLRICPALSCPDRLAPGSVAADRASTLTICNEPIARVNPAARQLAQYAKRQWR